MNVIYLSVVFFFANEIKNVHSLGRPGSPIPEMLRPPSGYLDFQAPPQSNNPCDRTNVNKGVTDAHAACNEECLALNTAVTNIYRTHSQYAVIKFLHDICGSVTEGRCSYFRKAYFPTCWCYTPSQRTPLTFCRVSIPMARGIANAGIGLKRCATGIAAVGTRPCTRGMRTGSRRRQNDAGSDNKAQAAISNGGQQRNDALTSGRNRAPPNPLSAPNFLPPLRNEDRLKKSLIIDLDGTLIYRSFEPIENADCVLSIEADGEVDQVYVQKRPFVDDFLKRMGELYECVLFTAGTARYVDPIVDTLDRWGVFRARLYRGSCVYYYGKCVKNLSRLGRDLQKVVMIDDNPSSYYFQPDNAVTVIPWSGDETDTELRDLIPFMEELSKADNVYPMLREKRIADDYWSHPANKL